MTKSKPLDHQKRPFVFTPPQHLQSAHEDLQFFFHFGDYSCGISSNYSAFDNKFKIPTQKASEMKSYDCQEKPKSERYTRNKINKTRFIAERFARLTSREKYIAQLFFYEQQFDRSLEGHFGFGIKLIPLTTSFQKLPPQWKDLHKIHAALIHKRNIMDQIKSEVHELYLSVLESYAKT